MSESKFYLNDGVAAAKVVSYLAGLRGFPTIREGVAHLARTLKECTVSMRHLDATLAEFDDLCPTPKEIREVAWNLRPKFEPQIDQRKQWEAECGPPQPFPLITVSEDTRQRLGKEKEMWRRIKERLGKKDMTGVYWGTIYKAMEELGYPLTPEQRKMIGGADLPPKPPASEPPPIPEPRRITQADIDAAKQAEEIRRTQI